MGDLQELQQIAGKYPTSMTVDKLVSAVYFQLVAKYGYGKANAATLNSRYLEYKGSDYQFIKRASGWEVKKIR